ncbi:MAG: putative solute-binding protein, partial [Myxococcota bacterium]|nr:putative solute-binding protein [Myxococcota bacterium]
MKWIRNFLTTIFCVAAMQTADAATICVYDPGGKSGDYYRLVENMTLEAVSWGVKAEVKAYTDEATAVNDYQAKKCDGVLATGVRLQRFNNFPTTIEAIGALPDYSHLRYMLKTLTRAGAAKKLVKGEHETAGIISIGAVYLFVRNRNIDTVSELSGKRIAAFDYDVPSITMVDRVGAIMVPADLGTLGPKFNNGDVDACYVSAPVYGPFELKKGLGSSGGIVRLPLAQATLQLLVRTESFPSDFGTKSRQYFYDQFDHTIELVKKAEAGIPKKYWIELPADSMPGFDELFQASRITLRDKGAYDKKMLKVM